MLKQVHVFKDPLASQHKRNKYLNTRLLGCTLWFLSTEMKTSV